MNLDKAIEDVQEAETSLARELRVTGERHAAEHDLYHMSHTLARRCAANLEQLGPLAKEYGAAAGNPDAAESPGLMATLRRAGARLTGGGEASGLVLLHDLRDLYLCAQHAEIAWTILLQAAKAARDPRLIEVATACQEHAETRGKWLRTRIKEVAPQVLAAG
jgi:hypothetical protein